MKQYHEALEFILEHGKDRVDRTGVGTKSVFGYQMRFDLSEGFPAITTKKLAWKSVVGELLWFLEGSTDERRLAEITYDADRTELCDKTTIWTANADNQGKNLGYVNSEFRKELGPVYGHQWRNFDALGDDRFGKVDQIEWLINEIKTNPESRRLILSAWNPNQIDKMALPPCHVMSQYYVNDGKLSCHMYQRSADMFLGVPFNIASYALLTHILARICDLKVADLVWSAGDVHLYSNHMDQVRLQLERDERGLPNLKLPNFKSLDEVLDSSVNDYVLLSYDPWPAIKAPMAV
jgi:thymidylate synthase